MAAPAPAVPSSAPLPRRLGRYTLFDRIGAGGMAEIYLARAKTEIGAGRLVVVKQILPHLAESRDFTSLLIAEAKLAARLDHANVVQVLDLGADDGGVYIAMQYVEGFDLNELLRRCARSKVALPVPFSLLVVRETLRALDYAHRRTTDDGKPLGIVHRDVSPSNVLISLDGEIKLCDFGIARANDTPEVLAEDAVKGKAGYMSPEHARGEPLDARADVFAAGIVLWELLAGRKLYRAAEGAPSLLEQARAAEIPDLAPRGLAAEEKLHAIVKRALAPSRDDRYASAGAMLRDLEAYVGEASLVASPLRFADWLTEHFGEDLVEQRRARERAAKALEAGPALSMHAVAAGSTAPTTPTTPADAGAADGAADDDDAPSAPESSGERVTLREPVARPAPAPERPASVAPLSIAPAGVPPKRGPGLVIAIVAAVVIAAALAVRALAG